VTFQQGILTIINKNISFDHRKFNVFICLFVIFYFVVFAGLAEN